MRWPRVARQSPGKGSLETVRARIPLVLAALGFGGGILVLGLLAGWSPAIVGLATILAVAVGAVAGQTVAWVRVTTGRLVRLERSVNQRLEALKSETARRDAATNKLLADLREHIGHLKKLDKLDRLDTVDAAYKQLTVPQSDYRKALRELAQNQSAERRESRARYQQKLDDQVALLEAFVQLQRLVPMPLPMPRPGTWAASEDLLLWLAGFVLEHRPRLVVDLGSGQSSVWMAGAMRAAGYDGRVIGVDHDENYAQETARLGGRQGLTDWLTVIHAPLVEQSIGGRRVAWYDVSALDSLRDVDLLCVDGPPAQGAEQARWAALPFFRDRMSSGARVILDDMIRSDEQQIARDWESNFTIVQAESLPFEKGARILTLP